MNREETRLILNTLKVNYPGSFRQMTRDEMQAMLNLWSKQFERLPYQAVEQAVGSIISTDTREFAPNVGQIKSRIMDSIALDVEQKAIHAWEKLRMFIRSTSSWNTKAEEMPMYEKLDVITRRIYSYREAKSLALFSSDTLEYRRSEFIRLYRKLAEKRNEELLMDGNLVELADGKERFLSLGYTSDDIQQITYDQPARDIAGVLGVGETNE